MEKSLEKYESRAADAIYAAIKIQPNKVWIEQWKTDDQKTRAILRFTFDCPCGDEAQEFVPLGDLWKSQFDRALKYVRKNLFNHMRREGFLDRAQQ